ncbi:MAG: anaerobic ribonucleoside-triphosphate reductase activating protein [Chloroflexi bacterium]|jgi:pyruvate formate lyase activating enzyme|nr:anaerobic ribonucleoside-triphosphate reductase activating protein [Chloroflexota bacterium]
MKIAGLAKVSLIDFPGRIAATVFLAGCNLRCAYCHNRWMLDASSVQPVSSIPAFLDWLQTRVGRLDGVCISGGEPTLHQGLADLAQAIKHLGMAVKLDTNGTRPEQLSRLLDEQLVDYVAMDLKAPLDPRYSDVAGAPVDLLAIRQSLALLRRWGSAYELRTTVAPSVDAAMLRDMARVVTEREVWYLQPFRSAPAVSPEMSAQPSLREDELEQLAQELRALAPGVRVRATN